jgi:hypothetical protein
MKAFLKLLLKNGIFYGAAAMTVAVFSASMVADRTLYESILMTMIVSTFLWMAAFATAYDEMKK